MSKLTPLQIAILENQCETILSLLQSGVEIAAEHYCPFNVIATKEIEQQTLFNTLIQPNVGIVVGAPALLEANLPIVIEGLEKSCSKENQARIALYMGNCYLFLLQRERHSYASLTEKYLYQAFKLLQGSPTNTDFAAAGFLLGKFYYGKKQYHEAQQYLEETAEQYKKHQLPFHSAIAYQLLGEVNFFLQKDSTSTDFKTTLTSIINCEKSLRDSSENTLLTLQKLCKAKNLIIYAAIFFEKILRVETVKPTGEKIIGRQLSIMKFKSVTKASDEIAKYFQSASAKQREALNILQTVCGSSIKLMENIRENVQFFFEIVTTRFIGKGSKICGSIPDNNKKEIFLWFNDYIDLLSLLVDTNLIGNDKSAADKKHTSDELALISECKEQISGKALSVEGSALVIIACLICSFRSCLPEHREKISKHFQLFYQPFLKFVLSDEFVQGMKDVADHPIESANFDDPNDFQFKVIANLEFYMKIGKVKASVDVSDKLSPRSPISLLRAAEIHAYQVAIAALDFPICVFFDPKDPQEIVFSHSVQINNYFFISGNRIRELFNSVALEYG